ncbi:hypothetical protein IFVP408_C120185 [Vibrio parahaemolyticus]
MLANSIAILNKIVTPSEEIPSLKAPAITIIGNKSIDKEKHFL